MRTANCEQPTVDCRLERTLDAIVTTSAATVVLAAMACRPHVPAWAEMWLVAGTLFVFFKWLTWSRRYTRNPLIGTQRALGYMFGWVGLDADEFCTVGPAGRPSTAREWALALGKTLLGAAVLWGVIRRLPADRPIVIGGVGFAGLILFLHFGLFHLLALAWRRAGVGVAPIMRRPLLATSLADFWGQRWNRAYRRVSFEYFFRPAVSCFGVIAGTLTAFLASGIIHELVVSYPAGAGYGGPTAYFVVQGMGLLLERATVWRRLTSRNPIVGWMYTFVFLLGPVGLLFHGPFLTRVIAPFMEVIGARMP